MKILFISDIHGIDTNLKIMSLFKQSADGDIEII